jgi:hypothetical protein
MLVERDLFKTSLKWLMFPFEMSLSNQFSFKIVEQ